MQCKSCQAEIDPKWKHATESNMCPFCGSQIMDEELCKVFEALRDLLDDSFKSEYSNSIKDWLCSNYDLIPASNAKYHLTDDDINEFVEKGKTIAKQELKGSVLDKMNKSSLLDDESEDLGILVDRQSPERNSEFFERAGMPLDGNSVQKTQKMKSARDKARSEYKDLVAKIQKGEVQKSGVPDLLEKIKLYSDDNITDSDEELILEDESIPQHIMNMSSVSSKKSSDHNSKDIQALERLTAKSQNPSSGGMFRRSS